MTIPYLMNCPHSGDGWCLACVKDLAEKAMPAKATPSPLPDPNRGKVILNTGWTPWGTTPWEGMSQAGREMCNDKYDAVIFAAQRAARREGMLEAAKIVQDCKLDFESSSALKRRMVAAIREAAKEGT